MLILSKPGAANQKPGIKTNRRQKGLRAAQSVARAATSHLHIYFVLNSANKGLLA